MSKAPSIFAERPIEDVSDRYTFIPTISVVDVFRDNGWYPVEVKESRVRIDDKKGYQKHLIRFRHLDHILRAHQINCVNEPIRLTV